MKVFISWSGDRSKQLAEVIHWWLPHVLQFAKPYFTPADIDKGKRWSNDISKELEQSKMGIITMTEENLTSPWIMFEAGRFSIKPDLELTDVPLITELAHNEADKRAIEFLYAGQGIGRPFVAPPNLPPDRLKLLRDAFMATMNDPEFIAEAGQRRLTLEPQSGEELEALIEKAYATPKPIIERVGQLVK
jgi:hypothetical protein